MDCKKSDISLNELQSTQFLHWEVKKITKKKMFFTEYTIDFLTMNFAYIFVVIGVVVGLL